MDSGIREVKIRVPRCERGLLKYLAPGREGEKDSSRSRSVGMIKVGRISMEWEYKKQNNTREILHGPVRLSLAPGWMWLFIPFHSLLPACLSRTGPVYYLLYKTIIHYPFHAMPINPIFAHARGHPRRSSSCVRSYILLDRASSQTLFRTRIQCCRDLVMRHSSSTWRRVFSYPRSTSKKYQSVNQL